MKLRQHRRELDESMDTCIEIEPTREALVAAIQEELPWFLHVEAGQVQVEHYAYDKRIRWNAYIVTIDDYGVYGFTDGPLISETGGRE